MSEAVDPTTTEAWARLAALAASYEPDLRATLTPEWVDRQSLRRRRPPRRPVEEPPRR